jgi:hypothetical protein
MSILVLSVITFPLSIQTMSIWELLLTLLPIVLADVEVLSLNLKG